MHLEIASTLSRLLLPALWDHVGGRGGCPTTFGSGVSSTRGAGGQYGLYLGCTRDCVGILCLNLTISPIAQSKSTLIGFGSPRSDNHHQISRRSPPSLPVSLHCFHGLPKHDPPATFQPSHFLDL